MTTILALVIVLVDISKGCYINSYFRNARSWIGNVSTSYSHGNIDEY